MTGSYQIPGVPTDRNTEIVAQSLRRQLTIRETPVVVPLVGPVTMCFVAPRDGWVLRRAWLMSAVDTAGMNHEGGALSLYLYVSDGARYDEIGSFDTTGREMTENTGWPITGAADLDRSLVKGQVIRCEGTAAVDSVFEVGNWSVQLDLQYRGV